MSRHMHIQKVNLRIHVYTYVVLVCQCLLGAFRHVNTLADRQMCGTPPQTNGYLRRTMGKVCLTFLSVSTSKAHYLFESFYLVMRGCQNNIPPHAMTRPNGKGPGIAIK